MNESNCNKSFLELLGEKVDEDWQAAFDIGKAGIATFVAAAFSLTPAIVKYSGLVTEVAEEVESIWTVIGTFGNLAASIATGTSSLNAVIGNYIGPLIENRLKSTALNIAGRFLVAEESAAVAAFVGELIVPALAAAGAIVAGILITATAEATESFNAQEDKFWKLMDQPAWLASPQGVTASFSAVQDTDTKSYSDVALSALGHITNTTTLYSLDCPNVIELSNFADTLDVGKSDLSKFSDYHLLGPNLVVDMLNPYGGNIRVSDYDTVDYSGNARDGTDPEIDPFYKPQPLVGVYWHDGATQAAFFNFYDSLAALGGSLAVPVLQAALIAEDYRFPDDTLHVKGTENITLTNQDDRFYFSGTDYTIHSGVGRIDAGAGDDKILYYGGKHYSVGDIVDQAAHDDAVAQWSAYNAQTLAYAKAQAVHAAWVAAGSNGTAPTIPPVPVKPTVDINAGVAQQDLSLTLDGGTGNDWVLAIGGTKVTTAGGLGRDWLYNTSAGGKIWGDVANSILDVNASGGHYDQRYYITTSVDAQGVSHATRNYIADAPANADVIWWSGGTVLEDAQRNDVLKFFGIPLVGGSDSGGVAFSLIGAASGFTSAGVAGGKAQQGDSYTKTLYTDEFLPFITYQFVKGDNGQYDLKVGNVVTAFVDAFEAATNLHTGLSKLLPQFFGSERARMSGGHPRAVALIKANSAWREAPFYFGGDCNVETIVANDNNWQGGVAA